jgi:hypothetical protein
MIVIPDFTNALYFFLEEERNMSIFLIPNQISISGINTFINFLLSQKSGKSF